MKKRAAVVTDTVSCDFYFPAWYRYYAAQVGGDNIFVLSYGVVGKAFEPYELGGLWRLNLYNNAARANMMTAMCELLLHEYEYVVRVDTDEFLIADPRHWPSLTDYLTQLKRPYVTAAGYNVIGESTSPALDLSRSIIKSQRHQCYAYDALNKTCVVSFPTTWAPGFHFASVYPEFHHLYLFHMKFADLDMQVAIGAAVAGQSDERLFQEYHRSSRTALEANITSMFKTFGRGQGWSDFERLTYRQNFLAPVQFITTYGGVYHGGPFQPDKVLLEIPDEFEQRL